MLVPFTMMNGSDPSLLPLQVSPTRYTSVPSLQARILWLFQSRDFLTVSPYDVGFVSHFPFSENGTGVMKARHVNLFHAIERTRTATNARGSLSGGHRIPPSFTRGASSPDVTQAIRHAYHF